MHKVMMLKGDNMIGLSELGVLGIVSLVILALLLPFIVTVLVGVAFANMFGFSGVFWWAFVIFFYILICALFGAIGA